MKKSSKSQKIAIGMFLDGTSLQIVSLAKDKTELKLIDAQIIELKARPEPVTVGAPRSAEHLLLDETNGGPIDLTAELNKPNEDIPDIPSESETESSDDQILQNELLKLAHKKFKIAISVAEPEIYYATFATDWGLKDEKLKERIIENLVAEKPTAFDITPEDIRIVPLASGGILSAVRGSELNMLTLLDKSQRNLGSKMPKISFIETAEISLVNLVKANYEFNEDETTTIIYVGQEFSRLIFMEGNNLSSISQIIEEGIDSPDIAKTIYSRLLLSLDNLHLKNVDNIILTGDADRGNVLPILRERFSLDIRIDFLKFNTFDFQGIDEVLSRFAVAVGVALRALEDRDENFYRMDLLPKEIREKQKIFKLGIWGWMLLILLPLATFFFTAMTGKLMIDLKNIKDIQKNKQDELTRLEEPRAQLEIINKKLTDYSNIFSVLDSILVGTKTFSHFLTKVSDVTKKTGKIWITNIVSTSESGVRVEGYSLNRDRIPVFAQLLGRSILNKVEVQEIRERTVYYFEIQAQLEPK